VGIGDRIQQLWEGFIDLTGQVLLPDWAWIINTALPILLLLLLIGPIVSLLVLGWMAYAVRAPRVKRSYHEPQPVKAPLGEDGKPVFPTGEPFCYRDGLIYPANARRCEQCGEDLSVFCPKCRVGRPVGVSACGNCGLELRLRQQPNTVQPFGPPPGGAAAA
jgi:hypothetical protein